MSASKCALPLFLLMTALCGTSNAQSPLPPYQVSYCIEVQHEMWRNGATYWSTEYETSSLNEAQLVLGLFEAALENGSLDDVLGYNSFDWILVDVRLTAKYEWNLFRAKTWNAPQFQYQKR